MDDGVTGEAVMDGTRVSAVDAALIKFTDEVLGLYKRAPTPRVRFHLGRALNCLMIQDLARSGPGKGSNRAKLTEDMVREARRLHRTEGLSFTKLGRRYGVTPSTIRHAIIGDTFAYVPDDELAGEL